MATTPPPFSRFEWIIAWRYLRARKAEGGVSVMTWISLIGITLAVFALIATLAVRSGFRSEFVGTILGANAHVTLYSYGEVNEAGVLDRSLKDYQALADTVGGGAGGDPGGAAGQGAGDGQPAPAQCRRRGVRHFRIRHSGYSRRGSKRGSAGRSGAV